MNHDYMCAVLRRINGTNYAIRQFKRIVAVIQGVWSVDKKSAVLVLVTWTRDGAARFERRRDLFTRYRRYGRSDASEKWQRPGFKV